MSDFLLTALSAVIAFLTTWAAVPLISKVAVHRKLLDYPDGRRHLHVRPVPRLGGVAVFAGMMTAILTLSLFSPTVAALTPWSARANQALFAASCILFLIGLLDDLRGVRPALKLLAQAAAAALVVSAGFRVETISIVPGYQLSLGVFAIPVAIVWLVGVSNAYNLVDGLDGLAGGVGVIALVAIAASAAALGRDAVPFISITLIGALLGFLRYNFSPARIFLGDSGSLVVGFLLAVLSVQGATTREGAVYVLVPILALSYLLLDTGIAMLRRWLRGAPLSRADGRHIHHRLLDLGLSPARAVGLIYVQALSIALLGLCATFVPPIMTIAIAVMGGAVLIFIMVYGVKWLDYHEFLEAGASVASGLRKARRVIQDRIVARDVSRLVQDATSLEEIDAILGDYAPHFRFEHMRVGRRDEIQHDAVARSMSTWRFDYPIAVAAGPDVHGVHANTPLVLSIWCSLAPVVRAANAERVAGILAHAIADVMRKWAVAHPMERELVFEPLLGKHRRASGSHRLADHHVERRSSGAFRSRQPRT